LEFAGYTYIQDVSATDEASTAAPPTRHLHGRMKIQPERVGDDVIDNDLILVWGSQKRIITGADLLGRLLRGIALVEPKRP
jgi:hypothetical protein